MTAASTYFLILELLSPSVLVSPVTLTLHNHQKHPENSKPNKSSPWSGSPQNIPNVLKEYQESLKSRTVRK
eukprot:1541515-Amphidinium_carterae.1